jgi:hypothetical protein
MNVGPSIVLDKNAIQGFNEVEIEALHRHYSPVIVPVLANEVIADLRKPSGDDNQRERVRNLIRKLRPGRSILHAHYRQLLYGSLLGRDPSGHYTPYLSESRDARYTETEGGRVGVITSPSSEEELLYRCLDGGFTSAEDDLAKAWRESIGKVDLDKYYREWRKNNRDLAKPKSLQMLHREVKVTLDYEQVQDDLLELLLETCPTDEGFVKQIRSRWTNRTDRLLRLHAPYAYYVVKTILLFLRAIDTGLIGTRTTNLIDMEYCFYLPFCLVFTSSDKVHSKLAPVLMESFHQDFVDARVLKKDLARIAADWEGLTPKERRARLHALGQWPPTDENSFTYKVWKRHCKPHEARAPLSATQRDALSAKFKALMSNGKPLEAGDETLVASGDYEFIARRRRILVTDPCPCGTGLPYKDCCMQPKEGV